jgi:16S rRNA (guanine527-N7)-methyltransferase
MRTEFIKAIKSNRAAFGLQISDEMIEKLADYFGLVQANPLLHLVALCSPEEFATRHILESLTLLEHLPLNASIADVGAGAGLPSLPCLIVRDDLRAVLIESKEKKAKFLRSAISDLGLAERALVVNRQFEETTPGDAQFVTCRALDKFVEKLPRLLKWCGNRTLLFFGGSSLADGFRGQGLRAEEFLMPFSERRFLYLSRNANV